MSIFATFIIRRRILTLNHKATPPKSKEIFKKKKTKICFLVLSQSLSLSLLFSNPSLQSQIIFFNLIFRLAKMMLPEQILRLQCLKTQRNCQSIILRPLRWSNILRHRPHPLRRLPPQPWQNCCAHYPNRRPDGLLHPRFPQLQTRRLLWWFWWFLGFWWFLFFVWSAG